MGRDRSAISGGLLGLLWGVAAGVPLLLGWLSMGTGWSYPRLLPDLLDAGPWRYFFDGRRGVGASVATSLGTALVVALIATPAGLLASRAIRRRGGGWWLLLGYLPFVISPVVLALSLYDLAARLGVAGSWAGVVAGQAILATGFATVLFSEFWDARTDALEAQVALLGGDWVARWRHAIWPRAGGLIALVAVQAALLSWLDYGLAQFLGGGRVETLTVRLFGLIREGSVNLAALAALLLVMPVWLSLAAGAGWSLWQRKRKERS